MATGSISHGRAHSNDVAALLYATDEHGRADPLAYESQRLILRNQTLGGIDAVRLVEDMVTSPAFKDRDGKPQFKPLVDAIAAHLSEHEKDRFDDALDTANITDSRVERLGEQAAELTQKATGWLDQQISDGLATAQRRMQAVSADADRSLLERAAAGSAAHLVGSTQFHYGMSKGAATHAVNTLGGFVDLGKAAHRFATDAHYRDLLIGTAKMYAAELADDPRKPLTDAQTWARKELTAWETGLAKARAEGKDAEFLGGNAGAVGIEVAATLVPVTRLGKFGKLAKAFDALTPDNAHIVTEHLDDVGRAMSRGGNVAEHGAQALRGSLGVARDQGQLLRLVEAGRATGNLDAMLKGTGFTPKELGQLVKMDKTIFDGKTSFDDALNASLNGIDPKALGRRELGDIGEAIMTADLVEAGYTDIVAIKNRSGHGIDLVGRNPLGELEFYEVKTSAQGLARNQYGDPGQFITDRLELAIEAQGHWDPKNTTEGLSHVAKTLSKEIQQQGGQVNAKWVRLNLSREPDSLELRIDKSVEPWQATPSRTRGAMPDEPQPDLAQAQGPFGDPYLDRYYAAVMSGNTDLADRIANEFTQSPEGQKMLQQGNELYAQQQLQKQQQLQEQMQAQVRQGPVLTR